MKENSSPQTRVSRDRKSVAKLKSQLESAAKKHVVEAVQKQKGEFDDRERAWAHRLEQVEMRESTYNVTIELEKQRNETLTSTLRSSSTDNAKLVQQLHMRALRLQGAEKELGTANEKLSALEERHIDTSARYHALQQEALDHKTQLVEVSQELIASTKRAVAEATAQQHRILDHEEALRQSTSQLAKFTAESVELHARVKAGEVALREQAARHAAEHDTADATRGDMGTELATVKLVLSTPGPHRHGTCCTTR